MHGIKIPQHDFALKMQGRPMREGGVFAGHYGTRESKDANLCDDPVWKNHPSKLVTQLKM